MKQILLKNNFEELSENKKWHLRRGSRYCISRNGALIAFQMATQSACTDGFRIIGAHTDSPCLQIKPHLRSGENHYIISGVERYGGVLLHSWFDRELSLAGRVVCQTPSGELSCRLIDFKKPLVYIPSVAIHLNKEANKAREINIQTDLCPIFGQQTKKKKNDLHDLLVEQLDVQYPDSPVAQIHGFDLFCYDPHRPDYCGIDQAFITGPRLDNLLSCFVGIEAVCDTGHDTNYMLVFTNHEEIGSTSNSGALGNFLESTLARIIEDTSERLICQHRSFLLSLDNAHATHPNYMEKSDGDHEIILNHGPVIKLNANLRYATSARSAALFRIICDEVKLPVQNFVMRADMASGSTIGPLSSAKLGVEAIDVGAPTWGMHAIREITGSKDPHFLFRAMQHFLARPHLPIAPTHG